MSLLLRELNSEIFHETTALSVSSPFAFFAFRVVSRISH